MGCAGLQNFWFCRMSYYLLNLYVINISDKNLTVPVHELFYHPMNTRRFSINLHSLWVFNYNIHVYNGYPRSVPLCLRLFKKEWKLLNKNACKVFQQDGFCICHTCYDPESRFMQFHSKYRPILSHLNYSMILTNIN